MENKNTLLILGYTGFLGKHIFQIIESLPKGYSDILVSRSSSYDNNGSFILIDRKSKVPTNFNLRNIEDYCNRDVTVINCTSSRNTSNLETVKIANWEFPNRTLSTLLEVPKIRLRWLQFESFWQYVNNKVPDEHYVFWKNKFREKLSKFALQDFLKVNQVVLPHLIGPNDTKTRFLPNIFSQIMMNKDIQVKSLDEYFSLADVRDVADFTTVFLESSFWNVQIQTKSFPSVQIQLSELISKFIKISGSSSKVLTWNGINSYNPYLDISSQPEKIQFNVPLIRNLDSSLKDIQEWLSKDM